MHVIKLYGDFLPIGMGGIDVAYLQDQLKEANGQDLKVKINSHGGDVASGFDIYTELRNYAKENNAKITTYGEGKLASIATIVFLAGDKRILSKHAQPFFHNALFSETWGDADDLRQQASSLDVADEMIINHYTSHMKITREEVVSMMNADTTLTPAAALKIRFCTEVEQVLQPAAKKSAHLNNYKQTNNTMKKRTLTAIAMNTARRILTGAVAKKVMTASEMEVDFVDLDDEDVIEIGAYATVDGSPAEGEHVMKSGETYVFEAGFLTEIKEAEEVVETEAEMAMAKVIEDLTNKVVELQGVVASYKSARSPSAKVDPKAAAAKVVEVEKKEGAGIDYERIKNIKLK